MMIGGGQKVKNGLKYALTIGRSWIVVVDASNVITPRYIPMPPRPHNALPTIIASTVAVVSGTSVDRMEHGL